jgi:hypothetical protein
MAEPSFAPKQLMSDLNTMASSSAGLVITTLAVPVHPLLAVTLTT